MSTTIMHMSLDIGGVLNNWPLRMLKKMLIDQETGRTLTAQEAKAKLLEMYGDGIRYLPMGKCDNFDSAKGCLGHAPTKGDAA